MALTGTKRGYETKTEVGQKADATSGANPIRGPAETPRPTPYAYFAAASLEAAHRSLARSPQD